MVAGLGVPIFRVFTVNVLIFSIFIATPGCLK